MIPRITEERLRSWTLGQAERERLCLGLLALDGRFAEARPRRPRGGPDGARDMEAVLRANGQTVWGAVGFRDRANDSPDDKRSARDKFRADVEAARAENAALHGLVFFTNVDFTPGEVEDLESHGRGVGLAFVDVIYRERMRVLLDDPRGFALRNQYLAIKMSEAEQATFFSQWGEQIHGLLSTRLDAVEGTLREIKFLHASFRPVRDVRLTLELSRQFSPRELGTFGLAGHISNYNEGLGNRGHGLWFAFRDGIDATGQPHEGRLSEEVRGVIQSPLGVSLIECHASKPTISSIEVWTDRFNARHPGPFAALHALDGALFRLFATRSLSESILAVRLEVNGYVILDQALGLVWLAAHDYDCSWQGAESVFNALPGPRPSRDQWRDLRADEHSRIVQLDLDRRVPTRRRDD